MGPAEGEPVVLDSKTQGVQASGQQLHTISGRAAIVLESAAEAWMRQGSNEIHCSSLKYQPGPAGRLGQVLARGPGWFRGEKDPQPAGQFAAAAAAARRVETAAASRGAFPGSVAGPAARPQRGRVSARERRPQVPAVRRAHRAGNPSLAHRAAAVRRRRIPISLLPTGCWPCTTCGSTRRNWKAPWSTWKPGSSGRPRGAAPGDGQPPQRFQPATPLIAPPVASHWPYLRDPRIVLTAAYFPTAGSVPPTQRYQILGRLMRVRLILHEQQPADLAELMVEDGVRFQEIETAHPGERPMLITGDRVHALDVDPKSARGVVTVVGRPAHFEGDFDGRGLVTLDGPNINVDLGVNRLWVEGPGEMLLPLNRDPLEGRPLAQPGQLRVDWHKRMAFDGQVARFESDYPQRVNAISPKGRLLTAMLEVHLKQMIRFGESTGMQRPGQGQADVSRIFCRGGADLDSATFEPKGQVAAQRLQTADLSIDMVSGAVDAAGPGWLEPGGAWLGRFDANDGHARRTPQQAPARPPAADDNALACLAVRFEGSLNGNIHTHEATFHEQVRRRRPPVDRWDAHDRSRPARAVGPPPRADALRPSLGGRIADARRGPPHSGNAGRGQRRGRCRRPSPRGPCGSRTCRPKDLLILEGDGWTDAELFRPTANRRSRPTAPHRSGSNTGRKRRN